MSNAPTDRAVLADDGCDMCGGCGEIMGHALYAEGGTDYVACPRCMSADFAEERLRLKAEIDALRAGSGREAERWEPIGTAPKDGREIPCLSPQSSIPVMLKFYQYNGLSAWRDQDQDIHYPTHWFPLPAPPASPDDRARGDEP